jgi:hypothetical protein
MNDTLFQTGGITGVSPTGLARLFDPSGINAVGNGIGHDILGALDGRWDQAVVLNDAYESDLDRFDRGTVRLPFSDLTEGPHTFSVRAWDAYNNPAVGSVDSVLGAYDRLATALCSAWDAATTASRPSSRFRWAIPLMIC